MFEVIGHPPIVQVQHTGRHTKAEIYVKCELIKPGGSAEDRIGVEIVNRAEADGYLKPGGTFVKATRRVAMQPWVWWGRGRPLP